MIIRKEQPQDYEAIRRVNEEAFKGTVEADLIEVSGHPIIINQVYPLSQKRRMDLLLGTLCLVRFRLKQPDEADLF